MGEPRWTISSDPRSRFHVKGPTVHGFVDVAPVSELRELQDRLAKAESDTLGYRLVAASLRRWIARFGHR